MKPIILTQEAKDNALEIFKQLLDSATDSADLKINITTETLLQEQGIVKPTVYVLASAFCKMTTLIHSSNDELAWYGIASRINNNYLIEDILVYPQTVTSATVDADEEKCAKWFMELPDDIINNLKFQGHSHVNMTATPSGRDTNNWIQFANILKPNEFMILCIGNKKGDFYWNIYDKAINVFFENKDITMCIVDEKGNSIKTWAEESVKKYITKELPKYNVCSQYGIATHKPPTSGVDFKTIQTREKAKETPKLSSKESVAIIPKELRPYVEYEVESDCYYSEEYLPGFAYSSLYGCYIMDGVTFRERMITIKPNNKKDKKNK